MEKKQKHNSRKEEEGKEHSTSRRRADMRRVRKKIIALSAIIINTSGTNKFISVFSSPIPSNALLFSRIGSDGERINRRDVTN